MKATVADLKASSVPETLNVRPSDPRLIQWLNMATERLLNRGDWIGAYAKVRVCVRGPCFAWPRQVLTVEKAAICNQSVPVRTQWYEFEDYGPGLNLVNLLCPVEVVDDGFAPTVSDIQGSAKYIKVYGFVPEDADAEVRVEGYDENNQWIRTEETPGDGDWLNGEGIPIALTPNTSTRFFGSTPTAIRKPRTKGSVSVYTLNPDDNTEILLAAMQYDETVANYRRSRIINWHKVCTCGATPVNQNTTLTAIVKLGYVPVSQDEDWLLIPNLPAMQDAMQGVQKIAKNLLTEGYAYLNSAVNELNKEIRSNIGRDKVTIGFHAHGASKLCYQKIGGLI